MPNLKFIAKIEVSGGCEICKVRIENHLMTLEGIISAKWNLSNKNLRVEMTNNILKLDDIHKALAAIGHSTERLKAKEGVVQQLSIACQQHV